MKNLNTLKAYGHTRTRTFKSSLEPLPDEGTNMNNNKNTTLIF